MNGGRQFVVFLAVLLVLLSGVGCTKKKKPQLPRQAMAPAEPIPSPLPPEISEQTPPPPPPAAAPEEPKKTEETKPQPAKHHRKKQPPPSTTAQNNSGTQTAMSHPPGNPAGEANPDIAIAADVSTTQLMRQKRTTAQLIDSTEKTLNGLHNLSHDEELMVTEIRSYVTQSRKATTDGDFERAYNLATKAHLLSDALIKK